MKKTLTRLEAEQIANSKKERLVIGQYFISHIEDVEYKVIAITAQSMFNGSGEYCVIVFLVSVNLAVTTLYPLDYFKFKAKFRPMTYEDRLRIIFERTDKVNRLSKQHPEMA
jgi:hypothetical protein